MGPTVPNLVSLISLNKFPIYWKSRGVNSSLNPKRVGAGLAKGAKAKNNWVSLFLSTKLFLQGYSSSWVLGNGGKTKQLT